MRTKRIVLAAALGTAVLIGGGTAALATRSATEPAAPAWVNPDGTTNADAVPAFIPAVAQTPAGPVAGWVEGAALFGAPATGPDAGIPVYARPDTASPVIGYVGSE